MTDSWPCAGAMGRTWSLFLVAGLTSVSVPAQERTDPMRMVLVSADLIRSIEESQRVVTGLLRGAFEDVETAGRLLGKKSDMEPVLEVIAGAGRMSFDLATPSRETTDGVTVPLIGFCGEDPESAWTSTAVRAGFSAGTRIDRLVEMVESFGLEEARDAVAAALPALEGIQGDTAEAEALLTGAGGRLDHAMQVYETGVAGPFIESLVEGVARMKDASFVSERCRDRKNESAAAPENHPRDRGDGEAPDLNLAQVARAGALGAIRASLNALDAVVLPEGSSALEIARGFRGPVRKKVVPPVYSNFARRACMQGDVLLELGIDRDGTVQRIRVLRGLPELSESAVAAARQWKFEPASLDGEAVGFNYRLTVNFDLSGAELARCRGLRRRVAASN